MQEMKDIASNHIGCNKYNFRTLNYLGSKLRLLDFIEENVLHVTGRNLGVCDLFAGTGCVSYRLSQNYPIYTCDIQEYSEVICNALLGEHKVPGSLVETVLNAASSSLTHTLLEAFQPLIQKEECGIQYCNLEILSAVIENGSVEVFTLEPKPSLIERELLSTYSNLKRNGLLDKKTLISRYYGGVYFSYRQAVYIDIFLETIEKNVPAKYKDLFLAALLSTASDLVNTVGKHFAQPLKARDSQGHIKKTVYNKALANKTVNVVSLYEKWLRKYIDLPQSHFKNVVFKGDYLDCLRSLPDNVKTVYADPPYTRDHYSRFYHVLETMTLRDNPALSTVTIHGEVHVSNGIYRSDRYQSPFCIKSQAPAAFREMFGLVSASNRNLLLSYSPYDITKKTHPRVVTLEQLSTMAKEYFNHVEIVSAGLFSHNKLNSSEHFLEASDEAEVLVVCK